MIIGISGTTMLAFKLGIITEVFKEPQNYDLPIGSRSFATFILKKSSEKAGLTGDFILKSIRSALYI